MKKLLLLPLLLTLVQAEVVLEPLLVSSSTYQQSELDFAAAVEIYTQKDIEDAQAENLYDFLNQSTSITVLPSYGNLAAQLIDLRGYGIGNGYENIVIKVNGRRLNNIDGVPQLLSSISIDTIERIEILKGSGAVMNGDGANAGVINIILKESSDIGFKTYVGNFGTNYGQLSAGINNETITASVMVDSYHSEGNRELNATTRKKDAKSTTNLAANFAWHPNQDIEWYVTMNQSDTNTSYAKPLTLANFEIDPSLAGSGETGQIFYSKSYGTGLKYQLHKTLELQTNVHYEDKSSEYSSGFKADYRYTPFDLSFLYSLDSLKIKTGIEGFQGSRTGSDNTTDKNNLAAYIAANFIFKDQSLNFGFRTENVDYTYTPTSGSTLNDSHNLQAFEFGYNNKLSKKASAFLSYTHSYQAPNIDRFFNWGGTFNAFIDPAKVDTVTLGYNNISKKNRLKAALFYSYLVDEIYYNAFTFENTNLDFTQKFGFEFYDKFQLNDALFLSLNYNYIDAKILSESSDSSFNNKTLPGVSDNNLVVSLGYLPSDKSKLILSHSYRSEAYAANDFANNFSQKQVAYNSTDLTFSYTEGKLTYFSKVQNLFDYKNAIWIKDDNIYPVNFTRTILFGISGKY